MKLCAMIQKSGRGHQGKRTTVFGVNLFRIIYLNKVYPQARMNKNNEENVSYGFEGDI